MIRRWLPYIALAAATIALLVSIAVFVRLNEQDEKLNDSRVEQTAQGCRERNEEREIFRSQLHRQLAQTMRIPARLIEEFGVTKPEALAGIRRQISELQPLDCTARVDAVRDTLD